ncbi:MAG: hypothetical protein Q8R45_15020 [Brevundimonas sp.]|uniref:hypothetical protein n=1 Tax=Brevundimonas sp. TaxID=1871086 RepID=UPI0027340286|nr:hypothetical protein [Brevundimonas sp.]MDP3658263.1 hypothetical protein [Brevundimonas sp.]MDZ4112996.1 hypothetical protein [Brevundimonas sp.]
MAELNAAASDPNHASASIHEALMHPYHMPERLPPRLDRTLAYWRGLLRKAAPMPFWDDLVPGDMGDLQADVFTLEVFDKPERFRFGLVGENLEACCIGEVEGLFLGEDRLPEPFGFLLSQASATIESAVPTLHRSDGKMAYSRLLLPMWGEGRIGLVLGVIDRS